MFVDEMVNILGGLIDDERVYEEKELLVVVVRPFERSHQSYFQHDFDYLSALLLNHACSNRETWTQVLTPMRRK